jgi:hypothetical protein
MKKHLIKSLAFCILGLGASNLSAQYCTTGGPANTIDSNVDSVGLTGDAATSISYIGCVGGGGVTGVNDQTALSANVTAGNAYTTSVQFGTCGGPYAGAGEAWIDWNQNDVFDPAESIGTWTGTPPTAISAFGFTVPLTAFNGTTRMRVIQQEGGTVTLPLDPCASFSWGSVTDFNIVVSGGVTISCANPSILTTANLTATSVDLGWTENGSASLWTIEYGAQGFAPGSGTMMAAATNPANVTGLMPNTAYQFYVNAVCAPGDSSAWVGPFPFTTPCAVYTPSYTTDFATYLPTCWDQATNGTPTTGPLGLGSSSWFQSGNSARVNLFSDFFSEWLLSPSFDLSAGGWELAINANATDYSPTTAFSGMGTDDTVQVLISTNGGTTWTPIYTWNAANPLPFAPGEITVDLSAYTGASNMFGIWASSGSTADAEDFYTYINSFEIRMPLSCPVPSALTAANITGTSADLGWTENGMALVWGIEYGPSGFAPGSGMMMAAATNPVSVTGLMPATNYEFYVRAICGPGDSSAWAGPFVFTTPCPTVFTPAYMTDFAPFLPNCWDQAADGNPATGPTGLGSSLWSQSANSARINLYTTTRSEWLLSPSFDLSAGGYELAINANATDYSPTTAFGGMGSDDTVQVLISTNGGTTWTPIYTWDAANPLTFAAAEITVDLSAYSGTSNMFGIWAADGPVNDLEDYYALINSFEIRSLPVQADLVITEIMYNPPEGGVDSLEFVEIYNNGAMPADLANYTLSGITYTFPAVTLPAGGYYVVGVNASAFNTVYGFAADGIATGGLSNGGETVIIRDPMGIVIDSVNFDDNTPWPSGFTAGLPDGGGSSIILCDTASDNADGANWNACVANTGMMINGFAVLASPGAGNNCPAPLDVAVAGFYNLDSTYCNVATITGSVIITNMSATDATNVPYSITANGTPLGGGTITSLPGMTSDTISVGPFPAATGIANIVAMTSLTGDANTANDMMSMVVTVSNTSATASVMTAISCNGDSTGAVMATATDGIGTYSFLWNADANLTNATLMNIGAGMYTVVVMDSIGCTDTAMVTLTEPTAIVLTDSVNNVLCNGDATGMAMVMATGGTPGYTYAWSNGATTDAITGLTAGSYTVTVTDANGCMEMLTSTISEPTTALSVMITDNGDGTADAAAMGGTAGYAYLWDAAAANQTTATATGLVNNGTYSVTATDANGCTSVATVTVTIVGLNNIANLSSLNLFPNPTNANVFVALELVENADVQINITNSIGQLVISKELTNVQSEKVELNTSTLASGVYMVQFTIGTELVTKKLIVNK